MTPFPLELDIYYMNKLSIKKTKDSLFQHFINMITKKCEFSFYYRKTCPRLCLNLIINTNTFFNGTCKSLIRTINLLA